MFVIYFLAVNFDWSIILIRISFGAGKTRSEIGYKERKMTDRQIDRPTGKHTDKLKERNKERKKKERKKTPADGRMAGHK